MLVPSGNRTPELAVALAGRVTIAVSGVVVGKELSFEWGYTAPPAMFIEADSFTIDGEARDWVPKPETRNPKPEARNPKPETRNLKPETRNPKPEARNPKPET